MIRVLSENLSSYTEPLFIEYDILKLDSVTTYIICTQENKGSL